MKSIAMCSLTLAATAFAFRLVMVVLRLTPARAVVRRLRRQRPKDEMRFVITPQQSSEPREGTRNPGLSSLAGPSEIRRVAIGQGACDITLAFVSEYNYFRLSFLRLRQRNLIYRESHVRRLVRDLHLPVNHPCAVLFLPGR
jgi:hypothetical protein